MNNKGEVFSDQDYISEIEKNVTKELVKIDWKEDDDRFEVVKLMCVKNMQRLIFNNYKAIRKYHWISIGVDTVNPFGKDIEIPVTIPHFRDK